jgi:hypothetical protein
MVAGTVVDPFGPIGLTEADWRSIPSCVGEPSGQ